MTKRTGLMSLGTLQRGLLGEHDRQNASNVTECQLLHRDTGKLWTIDGDGVPMPVFSSDAIGGAQVRLVNGQVGGKAKALSKLKRGRGGRVTLWSKD